MPPDALAPEFSRSALLTIDPHGDFMDGAAHAVSRASDERISDLAGIGVTMLTTSAASQRLARGAVLDDPVPQG